MDSIVKHFSPFFFTNMKYLSMFIFFIRAPEIGRDFLIFQVKSEFKMK